MFIQLHCIYSNLSGYYGCVDALYPNGFNDKYKSIPFDANPGKSKISTLETRRHSCIRKQNIKRSRTIKTRSRK